MGCLAVLIAALALASCGEGTPDAAKVYAEAEEKMTALTSYHVTATSEEAGESNVLEMDLMPPDRFQATFFWGLALIGIGGQFYGQQVDKSPDWFVLNVEVLGEPELDMAASPRLS